MKKLIYFSFILGVAFFASCAPDTKDDPANPSNPSTDDRDKYVAYWNATENSTTFTGNTFTINIVKTPSTSTEITINNFSGLGESARANVSSNLVTIPYQQIGLIAFAQGTGTLTSSTNLTLNYTMTIGANPSDTYTAVCIKQ